MTLTLAQTVTATGIGGTVSFQGYGGTSPYTYAVQPGGAGGMINASAGTYVAPAVVASDPTQLYDTVKVTDSLGATATAQILVGTPLLLFCDIIQNQLGLANGRVYLWDQKIMQPTDFDLYVAISVVSCKPFGNVNNYRDNGSGGLNSEQFVAMQALLDVDIISRGPAARDRKEEVILDLNSTYSQQQQESCSFYIAPLPMNFINLSQIDGAAIPYRYTIAVQLQYAFSKTQPISSFGTFTGPTIYTNP
jgi:hypothetical protein